MKHLQLLGVIAWLISVGGCESTDTAGNPNHLGNQESKRLAALEQQRQNPPPDEAQQNLWSAQENTLNRDGNPMRGY